MPRFLFHLQYEGSAYFGWQRQSETQPSIQKSVESALSDLLGSDVALFGAGRTDRGVHARAMPAHANFDTRLRGEELRRAIDVRLPHDIALLSIEEVAADFNCRHAALGKCYAYRLHNQRRRSPLGAGNCYFFPRELDDAAMRLAAQALVGVHDFSSFATLLSEHPDGLTSRPDPSKPDKPVGNIRELFAVRVLRRGASLSFMLFGDGFLRGMVRGIVGTLLEVGLGKIEPSGMTAILQSKDRREAGPNLPGNGLTLERVFYRREDLDRWLTLANDAEIASRCDLLEPNGLPWEF